MHALTKIVRAFGGLSEAARRYETSLLFQLQRFRLLHDQWLFSLDDALFWGLTDPALPDKALGNYMSREAATRLRKRVNAVEDLANVNDKARFYRMCSEAGLPIPETLGVLPSGTNSSHRVTDPQTRRIEVESLPDGHFVAKPVWGMKGKGLRFFEKSGDQFLAAGVALEPESLRVTLSDNSEDDDYVLQRRVFPHEALVRLSGSSAVQSARIVTFVDSEDRPHALFARFKIIRQGNDVDNFVDGEIGNLIADVELDTGRVIKVFEKRPGEVGLRSVTHHPDTGESLSITLPGWEKAVQLAFAGARVFKTMRSLAWDIALTPDGPVILEANQEWEIFPIGPYRRPVPAAEWGALIR